MTALFCRCVQRYVGNQTLVGSGGSGQLIAKQSKIFRMQQQASAAYSAQAEEDTESKSKVESLKDERLKEKNMSAAMRLYLNRKRNHDMFIAREEAEFEMGQQHLANMMGMDRQTMTQEDIDKSIEYLFPSGLIPEARPVMKPPQEIFPKQKEAEFDTTGRPFQPFFYTVKPNLNMRLYKLREHMQAVTTFGERLQKQKKKPDSHQVLDVSKLADSRWMTVDELGSLCVERVTDAEHKEFVTVLERLVELPYSYRVRDEIFEYRIMESTIQSQQSFLTPQYDEDGKAFVEFEGRRKTSVAEVKVTKPGSGEFRLQQTDIPGLVTDIGYFFNLKDRLQIVYPLQFTKLLGLVDIDVKVQGSGPSAQAGAIRYALCMCLRSFVDKETVDDMKVHGLLTQDIRVRERKKYGKVKARKAYTWKRR